MKRVRIPIVTIYVGEEGSQEQAQKLFQPLV